MPMPLYIGFTRAFNLLPFPFFFRILSTTTIVSILVVIVIIVIIIIIITYSYALPSLLYYYIVDYLR